MKSRRITIVCLTLLLLSACAKDPTSPHTIEGLIRAGEVDAAREMITERPGLVANGREGMPLLQQSVSTHYENNVLMAEMLIEQGADVNEVYEAEGWTALSIAMNNGTLSCVEVLLRHGASLERRDENGMTPLESAKYFLSTYTDPSRQAPKEVADPQAYIDRGIKQWRAVIELVEQEQARREKASETAKD